MARATSSGSKRRETSCYTIIDIMRISKEDVTWVVVVNGEIVHEAESKSKAREWADETETDPDRIASKVPLDVPIRI